MRKNGKLTVVVSAMRAGCTMKQRKTALPRERIFILCFIYYFSAPRASFSGHIIAPSFMCIYVKYIIIIVSCQEKLRTCIQVRRNIVINIFYCDLNLFTILIGLNDAQRAISDIMQYALKHQG